MDSGVYMALIWGGIGGVRSGVTGAANRLSPVSPRLNLGDRLGDRFGERLDERSRSHLGVLLLLLEAEELLLLLLKLAHVL